MHRRDFLKRSSFGAGALVLPVHLQPLFAHTARVPACRNLIIVHLQGGNDGLNTVVPFSDDVYYRKRPKLAIQSRDVIRLNDAFGFNPACRSLMPAYDKGQLLILNQAGGNMPASHYTACRTWEAGFCRMMAGTDFPDGAAYEAGVRSGGRMMEACDLGVCDETDFENRLLRISTATGGHAAAGIYKIALDGFDTHQFQRLKQDRLLTVYANGISALIHKLSLAGQFDQTLILTYSEFGRAVAENAKHGTEHGSAHPVFLFGGQLREAGIADNLPCPESSVDHEIDLHTALASIRKNWLYEASSTAPACTDRI